MHVHVIVCIGTCTSYTCTCIQHVHVPFPVEQLHIELYCLKYMITLYIKQLCLAVLMAEQCHLSVTVFSGLYILYTG